MIYYICTKIYIHDARKLNSSHIKKVKFNGVNRLRRYDIDFLVVE